MLKLVAFLFLALTLPAHAVNELAGQPFSDVVEAGKKHGVVVEHLNTSDTAALDEAIPGRPRPSAIHLLTLGAQVIVVLESDGQVIFSSDPVKIEVINKMLSRTAA